MPNQQVQRPASQAVPAPCVVTPALLKQHSITPDEYTRILALLGRTPSLTELGIFSVMWSEHCSYKSSRVHLKRLPTRGTRTSGPGSVVQGPGENAGIIDVGDGWACAFKIESHNHPSYIEPYQGAATGVGGILRDIFTMGARPLAVMDSLRFGPLTPDEEPDDALRAKNHQVANGVVAGVAGYGNCFGVPNLGGETRFEPCYSGNPLLNAFALGLVRKDEIFYAKATGVGNPVIYVGAKTGRDGIHGATMASEEFTEGSEQKRPNVQMGDPFLEKLLLEACLEAMHLPSGAVLGIQDMGAAGLTCSTCEMGARGELGLTIELDLVPQRETGMSSYEIMLSESQERMLLVAERGKEVDVLQVFAKWGLDAAIIGTVTADDIMRVTHGGTLVAEIPNKALTDDAPVYHRPVGAWNPPVPRDPPAWVLEELQKPRDYTADLLKLLASPNICDKRYIYEQYDSMVQTNTVQGPGSEAGVLRIKGTGHTAGNREQETGNGATGQAAGNSVQGTATASTPDAAKIPGLATGAADTPKAPASVPAPGLDPIAVDHSIAGKLLNLIAASTPQGEATLATGNEDATNPVLAPDETHTPSTSPTEVPPFPPLPVPTPISPIPRSLSPEQEGTLLPVPCSLSPVPCPLFPAPSSLFPEPATTKPERGLAMALAGNGRWCYLDPKLGAMHAVAEAARKVACTGATPVAATNCLNFGNPEKPEIMAQLSLAIDGIAEAATALGTPITGGNVSLYNETRGEGIYPTPVIGVVGILEDVTKAVPSGFQRAGDAILYLWPDIEEDAEVLAEGESDREKFQRFGSSEFARLFPVAWGTPPIQKLKDAAALQLLLRTAANSSLLSSAQDISDGGLAVTLAKACISEGFGSDIDVHDFADELVTTKLFYEFANHVVITCSIENIDHVEDLCDEHGFICEYIGSTGGTRFDITVANKECVSLSIADLRAAYTQTLPSQLAAEVVPA